jgi:hypothetical protein
MRVNPASKSVVLDYPYSKETNHRSMFVLYSNDLLTVSRGYFVESGAIPNAAITALEQVRVAFPDLGDKPYYPSTAGPTAEAVTAFTDWLLSVTLA